ncbi:MAG: 30S ribosomal protein S17 [Nitrososphaerales archaeon]
MSRNIGVVVKPPTKECQDDRCPFHGTLSVRGRLLTGNVVSSKTKNMIVVEREYPHLIKKYKRYERSRSRIHAYHPPCIDIEEGDSVRIAECRPLSKTMSFVVVEVREKVGSNKE